MTRSLTAKLAIYWMLSSLFLNAISLFAAEQGSASFIADSEIQTKVGNTVAIDINGLIWTYIPENKDNASIDFQRHFASRKTSFIFSFNDDKVYNLTFSRQIPSTGKLAYYRVRVVVAAEQQIPKYIEPNEEQRIEDTRNIDLQGILANDSYEYTNEADYFGQRSIANNNNKVTTEVLQNLRAQLENNELEAVYNTLASWNPDENGLIFDEAARAFYASDMLDEAIETWKHNLGLDSDLLQNALYGLSLASAKNKDKEQSKEYISQFLALDNKDNDFSDAESALLLEQIASPSLNNDEEVALLNYYIDYFPESSDLDLYLFSLGQKLEQSGPAQDLQESMRAYMRLQEEVAVSKYNADASARIKYLNRNFFVVY